MNSKGDKYKHNQVRPLQQETTTKTTLQRKRNDACARIKATGSAKNNKKRH